MERESLFLSRIRVYPLKGAGGLDLQLSKADLFGIPGDRRWMLVGTGGLFISQRTHPGIALIGLEFAEEGASGGAFRVQAPGMSSFLLSEGDASDPLMEVQLHKDRLRGRVLGEAGKWFSDYLGEECRLVFFPPEIHRVVDPEFAPGHRTSFSDGYPLLVTTEASLDALNQKLPRSLSMLRFRPNLVIRGGDPWEEDSWRVIEIGSARIDLVKACARCSVTTVDQGTGTRGKEPLRTLARIREWEGKTSFGQNAVFSRKGSFRVGDGVRILERGKARPPLSSNTPLDA